MNLLFWILILLGSIWAAHWGSDKLAEPLNKLRQQWGLTEAAGAAFVALATASPEIGTNTASAIQGLSDIGLGNLLGSNIVSVPAIVTVAYFAAQKNSQNKPDKFSQPLKIKLEALTVQTIPYLLIIGLAALLTIPKPWRGLQPIDGWLMLVAYFIYLAQAIIRNQQKGTKVNWKTEEIIVAIAGILALIIGAYFTVTATEKIVSILGIAQLVGGLFITSTLSIVPEVFATWSVAKSGQFTAATTSVIADNTATMTLAFFPLALVSLPVEDIKLYSVNLFFVALLGVFYSLFIYFGKPKYSFSFKEVLVLNSIYIIYLLVMIFGVLR
ncbi:MAG: sodium:calcium exchanger [Cyanobacteriota bacterium]|nr:sodium:calcium exchanger [Cyanobacteriota bacterium]